MFVSHYGNKSETKKKIIEKNLDHYFGNMDSGEIKVRCCPQCELTCQTVSARVSNITDTHAAFLHVWLAVPVIVTVRTVASLLAAFKGIHYFQWCFEVVHMLVVGYPSYTAIEASVVEVRIGNAWIFHASNLEWPKAVQVTVR